MFGVSTINIELTSRCNKDCWMCGRRKLEKEDPHYAVKQGDMDFDLFFESIVSQLHAGMVVQLHWNGEPTLYPYLYEAAALVKEAGCYVCMDTNGLLLGTLKAYQVFDSITVSVISNDSLENWQKQVEEIEKFTQVCPTMLNIRFLGDAIPVESFENLISRRSGNIIRRTLHDPEMSSNYKKPVVKPEIGVCLDLLHHLAIDFEGNVFPCVRINPDGYNCLGSVVDKPLEAMAGGMFRRRLIEEHFAGNRSKLPLCGECDFYGCPVG